MNGGFQLIRSCCCLALAQTGDAGYRWCCNTNISATERGAGGEKGRGGRGGGVRGSGGQCTLPSASKCRAMVVDESHMAHGQQGCAGVW